MKIVGAVALVAAVILGPAAPASAHSGGGPQATNYRSTLIGVVPPQAGVTVRLLDLGRRIRLKNTGTTDVVVLGYQDEPYLRVGPAGVFENRRSPTVYLNRTVAGGGAGRVPSTADRTAPPEWHRVSSGRTATWGDDRIRHTGPDPEVVRLSPGRSHVVVPQWSIPLRRGDTGSALIGSIVWVPGGSMVPWLAVAALLAVVVLIAGRSRWWGPLLSAATAVLIAVDAVHAIGLAAGGGRGPGAVTVRLLAASFFSIAAWGAGMVAVVGLPREKERGLLAACFCGAVIAVMSGVTDLGALTRSQLPGALPAGFARICVVVALGMGVGLLAAAASRLARMPVAEPAVELPAGTGRET